MEHEEAVRLQMTEQYLLDELSPEAREEFEEHYFDCRECAADVGAGAAFVEQSKTVFAEEMREKERQKAIDEEERKRVPVPSPPDPIRWGSLVWFRRVLAMPVLTILLLGAGYQNFVVLPRLTKELNTPQVLPVAALNIGTFSSEPTVLPAQPGGGFEVVLRIPPQDGYTSYTASLFNPNQKLDSKPEWTVTIPSALAHSASSKDSAQDRWAVRVPGAKRQPGSYTIVVRGTTHGGASEEVGRGSFEFQDQ